MSNKTSFNAWGWGDAKEWKAIPGVNTIKTSLYFTNVAKFIPLTQVFNLTAKFRNLAETSFSTISICNVSGTRPQKQRASFGREGILFASPLDQSLFCFQWRPRQLENRQSQVLSLKLNFSSKKFGREKFELKQLFFRLSFNENLERKNLLKNWATIFVIQNIGTLSWKVSCLEWI